MVRGSVFLFDAILTGDTEDLTVDIAQLDPYLRGAGKLSLQAVRDNEGTRVKGLQVTTDMADIFADADLTSNGSKASLKAALNDISPILTTVFGDATLQGDVAQDVDGNIVFDVNGTAPDVAFAASGDVQQGEDTTINFATTADVTDLARYNSVTGQSLSGSASFSANGVVLGDGQRFDVNIDGTTRDLQTGIAQLDPLLKGTGKLTGEIARTGEDQFSLRGLNMITRISLRPLMGMRLMAMSRSILVISAAIAR